MSDDETALTTKQQMQFMEEWFIAREALRDILDVAVELVPLGNGYADTICQIATAALRGENWTAPKYREEEQS